MAPLNAYSASPAQIEARLDAAQYAYTVCGAGAEHQPVNASETASLQSLRRGMFAKKTIRAGEPIESADVYFAFPHPMIKLRQTSFRNTTNSKPQRTSFPIIQSHPTIVPAGACMRRYGTFANGFIIFFNRATFRSPAESILKFHIIMASKDSMKKIFRRSCLLFETDAHLYPKSAHCINRFYQNRKNGLLLDRQQPATQHGSCLVSYDHFFDILQTCPDSDRFSNGL